MLLFELMSDIYIRDRGRFNDLHPFFFAVKIGVTIFKYENLALVFVVLPKFLVLKRVISVHMGYTALNSMGSADFRYFEEFGPHFQTNHLQFDISGSQIFSCKNNLCRSTSWFEAHMAVPSDFRYFEGFGCYYQANSL